MAFRVLAANQRPDFRTISDFRKVHLNALSGLFKQVFEMCRKAGIVKLGNVALDGTKIQAAASKHKAMSYDRMGKEEARLSAEIEALLKQAQETDEQEDSQQQDDSETQTGEDDVSTEEQMGSSSDQMEAGETEDIDGEEANVSVDQDADLDADDSPDDEDDGTKPLRPNFQPRPRRNASPSWPRGWNARSNEKPLTRTPAPTVSPERTPRSGTLRPWKPTRPIASAPRWPCPMCQ